jgi:isopenicillin-N epimerase
VGDEPVSSRGGAAQHGETFGVASRIYPAVEDPSQTVSHSAPLARRAFLVRSGAALGALAGLPGLAYGSAALAEESSRDYRSWAAVRAAFPLSRDAAHFNAFLLSPHPQPVARAIERYRRALDPDPGGYLFEHESAREQEVFRSASGYLHAAVDEIALTGSTTMGLGLLYGGLRLAPGDEILTSTHDFYSTHEALRLRAARGGATVRKIDLYRRLDKVSADEIVSTAARAIRPRTRVLALTWVHSSTGLKLPVAELARAVAEVNRSRDERERVIFCLDGVHGFGVEDVDVGELGCDFFVSGCHKWLFGPRGTGILWGRRAAWARTSATIPSFDGRAIGNWLHPVGAVPVPPGPASTPGGFHAFEHRWALADAFAFQRAIGRARIARRTHSLAGQLKEGLAGMSNVLLHTPRSAELSSGLVCFELKTLDPPAAVADLRRRAILASVTPYAAQYVRLGASIVNTPAEVDRALRAIRMLR